MPAHPPTRIGSRRSCRRSRSSRSTLNCFVPRTSDRPMTFRERIQRAGAFLSGMIVPNISAFLAWGFITALFAPGGWLPNASLAALIGPMLLMLLPILIGFSGGRLVYGARGGVVGAVATMGAITASGSPMFLGAMIL